MYVGLAAQQRYGAVPKKPGEGSGVNGRGMYEHGVVGNAQSAETVRLGREWLEGSSALTSRRAGLRGEPAWKELAHRIDCRERAAE